MVSLEERCHREESLFFSAKSSYLQTLRAILPKETFLGLSFKISIEGRGGRGLSSSRIEQVLVCHHWIPVQNGRTVNFIRGHLLWKCHQSLGSSSTTGYLCNRQPCCSDHSSNFRCLRCLNCRSLWKHLVCEQSVSGSLFV